MPPPSALVPVVLFPLTVLLVSVSWPLDTYLKLRKNDLIPS